MIEFDDRGLLPAIVQDAGTGKVLTLAYMNKEALERTLEGPDVWFYSRSRGELWHKGETSGNYLRVKSVVQDCDADAVLVQVEPTGPACHTGEESCFHAAALEKPDVADDDDTNVRIGPGILARLSEVIRERQETMPEGSYTASLFESGTPRIAQKVTEEAGEVVVAAITEPERDLPSEMADLLYHSLVLLEATGVSPDEVWRELATRRG